MQCDVCNGNMSVGIALPDSCPEGAICEWIIPMTINTLRLIACYKCEDCGRSWSEEEAKKMKDKPNYIVTTRSFKGVEITECNTVEEAWNAIGNMSFGGIYDVTSPTGQCTEEFVPF